MGDLEFLPLRNYRYFESIKKQRDYLIQDYLPVASLIMLYSPPAHFKSLIALYSAICISSKRKWFGHRTRRHGILVCDKENHEELIALRLKQVRRGLGVRKKDTPIYFLPRTEGNLLDSKFVKRLVTTVIEYDIKLIIFDTLHRYGEYQENSADDLSKLFDKTFAPIIDMTGASIMFLHHTTKKGDYRGSGDLKGMCDLVFKIKKENLPGRFTLVNEKHRRGEKEPLCGRIIFSEKDIVFEETEQTGSSTNKREELKQAIKSLYLEQNTILRKSEITHQLKKGKIEYSDSTLKRALQELVEENKLVQLPKRKGYSLLENKKNE